MVDMEVELRQLRERLAPIEADEIRLPRGSVEPDLRRHAGRRPDPAGRRESPRRQGYHRFATATCCATPACCGLCIQPAVPVPEVLWEDAGDPPDVPPLFVMSFVEGTSLEPLFDLDGDVDDPVVGERMRTAARTMAALHELEPEQLGLTGEPLVGPGEEVDRWSRLLETVDPALVPGWEAVAAALRAGEPLALPGALVHGDFRLGNTLSVGARIAAVIDWEIWSLGDPRVDLGWFLANADPATYRQRDPVHRQRFPRSRSLPPSTSKHSATTSPISRGSRRSHASSRPRRGR